MDTGQMVSLVTGSGGAMVALFFWIRSLQSDKASLIEQVKTKDEENRDLAKMVIALTTDVQRSLVEKTGCKYQPDKK